MIPLWWLLLVGGIAGYAALESYWRRRWQRRADQWMARAIAAEDERFRMTPRFDLHPWYHPTRCYASADALIRSVGGRVVEERE